jgi:hypothetical protein
MYYIGIVGYAFLFLFSIVFLVQWYFNIDTFAKMRDSAWLAFVMHQLYSGYGIIVVGMNYFDPKPDAVAFANSFLAYGFIAIIILYSASFAHWYREKYIIKAKHNET